MRARFNQFIALLLVSAPLTMACMSTDKDDEQGGGVGNSGGSSGSAGEAGSGGDGGSCAPKLETCARNGDCCGFQTGDNVCVNTGSGALCAITCTSGSECASGCCAPLKDGGSVCAPADYCEGSCQPTGTSCTQNGDCCGFDGGDALCVSGICSATCTYGSDCNSGCCALLKSGRHACGPMSAC